VKRALIAIAVGLALADAAVVILALPPLLIELDTTVEGVAAVIGVYTAVLAVALPVSAALHSRATGGAGALLFAAASIGCASSNSLELLLVMRALQALGASALLASAFDALDGGGSGRRLWVGAAVVGTAAGPALGGALTELFDWRAIFVAQAPIALAAAPALLATPIATVHEHLPRPPRDVLAGAALALLSGALTAVVFLLVLLLISGWSVEPLAAAAAVTMLPLAAIGGSFVHGAPAARALAGCLLVAGGIAGLAFLPEASAWWTLLPQLLAGFGLGMAFPALAGELLHERTRAQAAALLSLRHLGITAALALLAPIVAAELDDQVQLARERGTALVLDAALPPTDKIDLAPRLFANLDTEDPRGALQESLAHERKRVTSGDHDLLSRLRRLDHQLGGGGALMDRLEDLEDQYGSTLDEAARGLDRLLGGDSAQGLLDDLRGGASGDTSPKQLGAEIDRLGADLDDVVLAAVDAAFSPAFVVTGAMALLAALLLVFRLGRAERPVRGPPAALLIGGAVVLALAVPAGYAIAESSLEPEPVQIADPCKARERRSVGGIEGFVEGIALSGLDRAACKFGSSREELVLALFDDQSRRDYEREHGVDPRTLDAVLKGIVGL
jgi:Major Facilitator Superfamily